MKKGLPSIHPGILLKEEIINANDLTITEAAKLLKVTRPALSNVLNGKASLSPEMSLRIQAVFGGSADFWLKMQSTYDLEQAAKKFRKIHLEPFSVQTLLKA